MGVQLYPPIIPNVLNAMYNEEGGIAITIPFSLNRAVSANQIYNFNIKIKTVFDNKTIYHSDILTDVDYTQGQPQDIKDMIAAGVISGHLTSAPALVVGQYYKIQVAFVNYSDETGSDTPSPTEGIYSSVATIKYTALPVVSIQGLDSELEYNPFTYYIQGNFDNSGDPSETRSEYCFELFDNEDDIIPYESSGWLIRDPDKEQDDYTFQDIKGRTVYQIQYKVKTINNVIVKSPFYNVEQAEVASDIEEEYDLVVENNFDNGYVIARIQPKEDLHLPPSDVDGMFRLLRRSSLEDRFIEVGRKHIVLKNKNNHTEEFRDFLIEQGETYGYAIQQYNGNNIYSIKKPDISGGADPIWITTDFEDSFLFDGTKQLKLRFNPKVTSYKINRQEQKLETIGSQYPFFVRNSKIAYHEFPISGLCSYWMDEEELFMTDEELGLTKDDDTRSKTEEGPTTDFSGRRSRTHTLQGYNFAAERKFKNKVLEWLGNGKPKFFKSSSEGNFIIRIMNSSLTPEDKTSRMIHNFSATGYEAMEINFKNLLENKFYKDYDEDSFIGTGQVFNKIINATKVNDKYEYYIVDPDKTGSFNEIKNGIANNGSHLIKQVIIKRKKLKLPLTISTTNSISSTNYTLSPVFFQENLSQPTIEFQDKYGKIEFDVRNIYDIRTIIDIDKATFIAQYQTYGYNSNKSQSFYCKKSDGSYELLPASLSGYNFPYSTYGIALIKKYLYDNYPPFNKTPVSINSTIYNSNQNQLYYYKNNNEEYVLGEETFVSDRAYYQRDRLTSALFVKINNIIQSLRSSRLRGISTDIDDEDNYKFSVITKNGTEEVLVTEEQPYTNFQTFQDFSINCDSMPLTLYIEVEYYDYKPIFTIV